MGTGVSVAAPVITRAAPYEWPTSTVSGPIAAAASARHPRRLPLDRRVAREAPRPGKVDRVRYDTETFELALDGPPSTNLRSTRREPAGLDLRHP